jgi:hypothetical protein
MIKSLFLFPAIHDVLDELCGPAEVAAGNHRWGEQTNKVLAKRDKYTVDLFQGQNTVV